MAIVFISPKERQRVFVLAIAGFFLVLLVLIGFTIILAKPKKVPEQEVFRAPTIRINFDVLNSEEIKSLEFLPEMEKEFSYTARTTAKGELKSGVISASSEDKARQILTGLGLINIMLTEMKEGRSTPFKPYYEITAPAPSKKTKK